MPRRLSRLLACGFVAVGALLTACSSTTSGIGSAPPRPEPVAVAPPVVPLAIPSNSPSPHPLGAKTLERIITASSWTGLRGHKYEVVDSFSLENDHIAIVSVDGAPIPGSLVQIENDLLSARRYAVETTSFVAPVQFGPRDRRVIRFDIGRPDAGVEPARTRGYWHYFMFASSSQDIEVFSDPVPSFPDSYTTWDPYDRLNVSMIKNEPDGDAWGVSTDLFYAAVEAFQTFTSIFTDPATIAALQRAHVSTHNLTDFPGGVPADLNMALDAAGREIYCNSMGYAIASAMAGVPYAEYARTAVTIPLYFYTQIDIHFFALAESAYNSMV